MEPIPDPHAAPQAPARGPSFWPLLLAIPVVSLAVFACTALSGLLKPAAPERLSRPAAGTLTARTPTAALFALGGPGMDMLHQASRGTLAHPVNLYLRLDRPPADPEAELCVWVGRNADPTCSTLAARLATSGLYGGDIRPREFTVDLKPALRAAYERHHTRGWFDEGDGGRLSVYLTCEPRRNATLSKVEFVRLLDGRVSPEDHGEAVIRDATLEFSDGKLHRLLMQP